MRKAILAMLVLALIACPLLARTNDENNFAIALPTRNGQLRWQAQGFKLAQVSAKSNGMEIGLLGKSGDGRLGFLGFLFVFSGEGVLTSAKCRDGVMQFSAGEDKALKIAASSEIQHPAGVPTELVAYTAQNDSGKVAYMVRGFVAVPDICGDLEFYSDSPINLETPAVKEGFDSFQLDMGYVPQFRDFFFYAQILYRDQHYREAAPIFEQSLSKLSDSEITMRRVVTDEAGIAYGISGNIAKSRALFETAIKSDPDYPLYYYNLACADAEENKLADARIHLTKAFALKANMLPGEKIPDPSKDDSFLPHKDNKEFWSFIEALH